MIKSIIKRTGETAKFNELKITEAVQKCFNEFENGEIKTEASEVTKSVVNVLNNSSKFEKEIPTVEDIQDLVEFALISTFSEIEAGKNYVIYRNEHNKLRTEKPIPKAIKETFDFSKEYFNNELQQFQYFDKYSRFMYDKGRRETWAETVDRTVEYLKKLSKNKLENHIYENIRNEILNMNVMPSMRLLAMAGKAADINNIALYNCSFLPVNCLKAFSEALNISMCGCGVGYSVERIHVEKLPRVKIQKDGEIETFQIPDTTEGWIEALEKGLKLWFSGEDIKYDLSLLRPYGAPLKTKGGRSSGPEPLRVLLEKTREIILKRQGSVLRPLDAHDIMCHVGQAAVSGGVRRTAMISLFDFDDIEMRKCKQNIVSEGLYHRFNSNNSAVWPQRNLTQKEIVEFMNEMIQSGQGEPGIFNRKSSIENCPVRRQETINPFVGTNPCGEINLYLNFCNLSSVVCKEDDDLSTIEYKIRIATIIGTIQSAATDFKNLRPIWKINCEKERLLGVDLNAQMDCKAIRDATEDDLKLLKNSAVEVNKEFAEKIGINPSVAVTCVKPSGNSGVLLNASSGMHPRWSKYYVRRVRLNTSNPIYKVFKNNNVPMKPEVGQVEETALTWVAEFPVKSPDHSLSYNDVDALYQLEYWKKIKKNYTEHNPSVTITYKEDEVIDIIKWVYDNQDIIGGLTFLPKDTHTYDLAPYEEITEEEYEKLKNNFPSVDYSKIYRYENTDLTNASQELACVSGSCEI